MEIVSMPPEIQDNSINYREISQIIRELIFLSQTLKSDWNKISEKSSFNLSRHLTSFYHDAIFPRSEPDDVVPIASYFIHEIRSPNRARNHRVHRSTRLDSTRDYSRIALRSFQLSIGDRPLPSRESLSFPYCGFQMKLYLRTVSMRQNLERRKWFVRPQPVAGVTSLSRNESKSKVSRKCRPPL